MTSSTIGSAPKPGKNGLALFSYGFRPFFLFGALYAALLILIWVPWFLGLISLPTDFPPTAWHSHELLFGYVGAAIAGFLLTAVANWTGRAPVAGGALAALFALWLAGRLAVAASSVIGLPATAVVCLAFPVSLIAVVGREIIAGRNWRNLKILILLTGFGAAQAFFHWEVWRLGRPVFADSLAIAAALTLIMVIGGRVIPTFTGNWLKARGETKLPPPFGPYDAVTMGFSVVALAAWAVTDLALLRAEIMGTILLAAALLNIVRQARWGPHRTLGEPLVAILHAAYFFIPAGFALAGYATLSGNASADAAATHAWTTGAIAAMTLAIMTRASLGHTGRALTASRFTMVIYVSVLAAAAARIAVALYPQWTMTLMPFAGVAWILAFLGFAIAYGPALLKPRLSNPVP